MSEIINGENLFGYKKKSFSLPYNGGEIWFEHLDGMYEYENLVLDKLKNDLPVFSRPSSSAYVCFVFDETVITDNIADAVKRSILETDKHFMKIAFVGLDRNSVRKFKKELTDKGFEINFLKGLEDAKEWLLMKKSAR
ncbi:MAG: hypothetical protein ACI4KH_07875 [Oscillospiraceae bacterium]